MKFNKDKGAWEYTKHKKPKKKTNKKKRKYYFSECKYCGKRVKSRFYNTASHKKCKKDYLKKKNREYANKQRIDKINNDISGLSEEEKKHLVVYNNNYLTLNNYKEPLKSVKKSEGFGYYGALCSTLDGELIQCHLCGQLFKDLGKHVTQFHKMKSLEYRDRFELAKTTALCSEQERQRRKKAFIKTMSKLSDEEKQAFKERLRERAKKGAEKWLESGRKGIKLSLETKNKRGVCPDQLLDKIKQCAIELGHTPSKHDFIGWCESQRYVHLIYKTFGSWSKAIEMLKLQPKEYVNNGGPRHYTNEELLEYLVIFAQENNKVPTHTDFRRGLLPDYNNYIKRFGNIENARQEAGVYDFVDDPTLRTGYAAKYHNG